MALDERGEQVFGRFRAAIRIEDFSRNTVLLQDAGKPPYAERRREKRVFAPCGSYGPMSRTRMSPLVGPVRSDAKGIIESALSATSGGVSALQFGLSAEFFVGGRLYYFCNQLCRFGTRTSGVLRGKSDITRLG